MNIKKIWYHLDHVTRINDEKSVFFCLFCEKFEIVAIM